MRIESIRTSTPPRCFPVVSESVLVKWGLKGIMAILRSKKRICFRECPCKMRIESRLRLWYHLTGKKVSESVLVKWGLKDSRSFGGKFLNSVSESVLVKWGLKECLQIQKLLWKWVSESVLVKWGLKAWFVYQSGAEPVLFQRVSL